MNQNQIGRTVFDIDEETDAFYLQKAAEYHEWLLQQEAQPRLTRTPIFHDCEDAERRLRADYFDDHSQAASMAMLSNPNHQENKTYWNTIAKNGETIKSLLAVNLSTSMVRKEQLTSFAGLN
ncbi:hypothetical protein Tco_1402204 [Tanacetum coccineum]